MTTTTQITERYIDPFRVAIFFLVMLLVATVYTYLIIELFGKSEFTSMSQTNMSDILVFGAASTIAFVVWKRFQKSSRKTLLLFGTVFQSVIMIGAITINNYIAVYPIISAPFQEWYWVGWVTGIVVQPVVSLGIVLSVIKNII